MAMTNYLEEMVGNVLFRVQAAYKPAAIWVGLFTSAPSDAGGGTEVSAAGYGRVQVTQADAKWNAPAAGNGAFSNVDDIQFGSPTADWGIITHWGIFDAETNGNLLIWEALTAQKTVNNGDAAPKFAGGAPGALVVTFS